MGENNEPTAEKIMQLALGFWGSKTLLSAIKLGVFGELSKGPLDGEELRDRLKLHSRGDRDFFDALVALGMLRRDGGRYTNTPETDLFLDKAKPSYLGGLLEMANERLYPFWGSLTEGLKTGQPQNEMKEGGDGLFEAIYGDPHRLRLFLGAMTGLSMGASKRSPRSFPGVITRPLSMSAAPKEGFRWKSRGRIPT